MKIIYPQDNAPIAIIHPTGLLTLALTAEQDVPHNVPYLVVDDSEIPADRRQRAGWVADFTNPNGFGGNYGVGTDWVVISRALDGEPLALKNMISGEELSKIREDSEGNRIFLNAQTGLEINYLDIE